MKKIQLFLALVLVAISCNFLFSLQLHSQIRKAVTDTTTTTNTAKSSNTSSSISKATQKKYQKGDMAIGANIGYGISDNLSSIGYGVKFQYNTTDRIRLEVSYTYFPARNRTSMWNLSGTAHYLFPDVAKYITLYPSVSIGVLNVIESISKGKPKPTFSTGSDFATNFGGGIDFNLNKQWIINGELKYQIADDWNRLLILAGLSYRF